MSLNREKIEKLVEKVDEMLVVLNNIAEDLRIVAASLKSIAVSQIAPPPSPAPVPEAFETERKMEMEDVKMTFPEDLEGLLNFKERDEYIMIKPRQFLGSENFAKIAQIVRGMGGDYVSAGKESHFRVPKRRA